MGIMLDYIVHLFKRAWILEFVLVICKDSSKRLKEAMLLPFIPCGPTGPSVSLWRDSWATLWTLSLFSNFTPVLFFPLPFSAYWAVHFSHCSLQMSKEIESSGSHYLLVPFFQKLYYPSHTWKKTKNIKQLSWGKVHFDRMKINEFILWYPVMLYRTDIDST